ncbi:MAG: sigma 54-interacting transcriptional regulator [Candidatus Eisenbacteria bacterium]|nr:sigma 54-interacting transcriptional regulator [Candidatus Eisenbacteria bacterium]MCC7144164.1 sigma 54-interacting transcriptional regulator [Candidatus Eisenbacteria bacterium]
MNPGQTAWTDGEGLPLNFSRSIFESLLEIGDLEGAARELERLGDNDRLLPPVRELTLELLWRTGDLERLLASLQELDVRQGDDPHATALAALYGARIHYRRSDLRGAAALLAEWFGKNPDPVLPHLLHGKLFQMSGKVWFRLREFSTAREQYRRSLGRFERAGDRTAVAVTLDLIAQVERSDRNWSLADGMLSKALRILAEMCEFQGWMQSAINLAVTRMFRGGFLSAELLLRRAGALAEEYDDPIRIARVARLEALLLTRLPRRGAAKQAVHRALRATLRVPDPRGRAILCEYAGEFRLAGGYLSSARRWLTRGHARASRIPERDIMGETQRLLAEVEFQSKNVDRAFELAEASLAAFEKMEHLYEVAVCRRVRGGILLHLGRTAEAIHDLERAVEFFTQMGERFEIYRAQRLLALARGEAIDEADTLIATLGRSYDAEGARLRAELEANEVDSIVDLLNQPFQSRRGAAALDVAMDESAGSSPDPGTDHLPPAPPNPSWPLTREQIEESISLARLRTVRILRSAANPGFPELYGTSPLLRVALQQVREIAPTDQPILIQGETGTGKELVARAVHDLSRRSKGPYVPVNCGSLRPEMVESELFGHQKGAFTGAISERAGLARTASGGTLFLDEIAELGPASQPQILRMLDSGEIRPVGADRATRVDVRLVTATHKDLRQAVEAHEFRRDLYHRLCGLTIYLPALRDRIEDLPILIEYFAQQLRERGIEFVGVSDAVLTSMSEYDWPGNVRELRNQIFALTSRFLPGRRVTQWSAPVDPRPTVATAMELTEAQIDAALRLHQGRVLPAAATLGISKQALYRLCERHGIDYGNYR